VLFAITVAMVIMNVFVIPQFAIMFARFNTELPLATRILLGSSNLFINHWQLMLAVLIGGIWALRLYLQTDKGSISGATGNSEYL
jgi:MSHA biogenesis protein MshG